MELTEDSVDYRAPATAPTRPKELGMIDLALFRDVLRSEWTKLRSVRSTYWSIFAAIVVGIGLGAAISAGNAHCLQPDVGTGQADVRPDVIEHGRAVLRPARARRHGDHGGHLGVQHRHDSYDARRRAAARLRARRESGAGLGHEPGDRHRHRLRRVLRRSGDLCRSQPRVSISAPGVLRAVIGGGLYIGALALFALGLGMILRHTAGAITALTAIVFILPGVSQLLPDSWQHNLSRYFPANAGSAITNVVQSSNSLGPWTGYAVFLGWVALVIGAGLLPASDPRRLTPPSPTFWVQNTRRIPPKGWARRLTDVAAVVVGRHPSGFLTAEVPSRPVRRARQPDRSTAAATARWSPSRRVRTAVVPSAAARSGCAGSAPTNALRRTPE